MKDKKTKRYWPDPKGDENSRRRRPEKKFYRPVRWPLTEEMVKPFQIIGSLSKTVHGAGIKVFSRSDGKPAFLCHVGEVIERDGQLVVSEAVFPEHIYTPISEVFEEERRGESRLTLMDIDPRFWDNDRELQELSEQKCLEYHLGLEGTKYYWPVFFPMAAYSAFRNLTPLMRGRFENIIVKRFQRVFICSNDVDEGYRYAQELMKRDLFLSTLHKFITTPQDIFYGPYTRFLGGWKLERIYPNLQPLYQLNLAPNLGYIT